MTTLEKYKSIIRDIWWYKITEGNEIKTVYPTNEEAYEALSTLVWYCVWKWMKVRDYKDSDDLLYSMRWWIRGLQSNIKYIEKYNK